MKKSIAITVKEKTTEFYRKLGIIFIVIFTLISTCILFLNKLNF